MIEYEVLPTLEKILDTKVSRRRASAGPDKGFDLIAGAGRHRFIIEVKATASSANVAHAAHRLVRYAREFDVGATPILVVPYMGDAGRRECSAAGANWFDLCGNAEINAEGLKIHIEGKPNRFKREASSPLFAPRSSRVLRLLLMNPFDSFAQHEITVRTRLSEGYVSRIIARLKKEEYLKRESGGRLRLREPALLLDAWRSRYDFSKHRTIAGHVAARSGDQLVRFVCDRLRDRQWEHAATGLAAAWAFSQFAAFRTVTLFVAREPNDELLSAIKFRDEPRGANLRLVVPNDGGVFDGSRMVGDYKCVHPIQAYLDLKADAERAEEAAEHLRERFFNWSTNA